MLHKQHIKSLELLSKFIAETPKEQLDVLIKKYENIGIEGPTFAQYLVGLENSFCSNNLIAHGKRLPISILHYDNNAKGCLESPPPEKKKINNQIPAEYAGISFLHTFVL